jgi:valyl-tRNA synthetase
MTDLNPASHWILEKYLNLEINLNQNLETYELAHSIDSLYHFLWNNYADWYVEYLKTNPSQKEFAKELFRHFVITLHPYMPFETETLWQEFFGENQLLAWQIKEPINYTPDINKVKEFEKIINVVNNLRSLRGLFAIDPVIFLEIHTVDELIQNYSNFLKLITRTEVKNTLNSDYYLVQNQNYTFSIDIFKYIPDINKEIARTQKLISNLQKQIENLEKQLGNNQFLKAAEPEIVAEKQADLENRKSELKQQETKLEFLQK